jgi:hypothetical protein
MAASTPMPPISRLGLTELHRFVILPKRFGSSKRSLTWIS